MKFPATLLPAGGSTPREVEIEGAGLRQVYELIGCDLIEIVRIKTAGAVLIVDESGMLKERPLNESASFLYGAPIVGDVLLMTAETFEAWDAAAA